MKTGLWTLLAVLVGAVCGALLGTATHPQATVPAVAAELPGVEPEPPQGQVQPLFADATPSTQAAQAPDTGAAAARPEVVAPPTAVAPTAVLVIPHGPGHFATLDLQAAELTQIAVYQGTLVRDGLANPAVISRAPKITMLRGPEPRVELLHLGFDREAQPVSAHVRLTEGPAAGQEGMVLLRVAHKGQPETTVLLRPIAAVPAEPEGGADDPLP